MKQIQPFQKHRLQLTSIVVCRLNHAHSTHLPQRQTWGHMVSSFTFSNHVVLCHILPAHNPYVTPLELPIVTIHIQIHDPTKLLPAHNPYGYITLLELPIVSIHIQFHDSH